MLKKLNGWARLLVTMSVIWVIALAFWSNQQRIEYSHGMATLGRLICQQNAKNENKPDDQCLIGAYSDAYKKAWNISPTWADNILGGVYTLPILWGAATAIFLVAKWIKAGFKREL